MRLPRALVALPLLALSAAAFLIPPTVDDVEVVVVPGPADGKVKSLLAGLPHIVGLECPGCLFEGREGVESKIHLQFEADVDRGLVINGVTVLPSAFDAPSPVDIAAVQVSKEDGQTTAEQPLDFALERLELIQTAEEPDVMIIPIRFTVLAIGGVPVKADTVAVHLVRTETELILVRMDLIPFQATPGAGACDGKPGWSLCRIKAIIMARVKSMMEKVGEHKEWINGGCRGKVGGKGKPPGFGWMGGRHPGRHGHLHHHHHHHGHRHWRMHRFGRLLHKTIRFLVIPALLGVIGGLMASAVGMLVGQILVHLWVHFYRRGQRRQRTPRTIEIVVREEKTALMGVEEDDDAPPVYEDVEVVELEKQNECVGGD